MFYVDANQQLSDDDLHHSRFEQCSSVQYCTLATCER